MKEKEDNKRVENDKNIQSPNFLLNDSKKV